ncbi:MAG: hypothetical protein EGQ86_19800 [Alistipes sp.]|uniref:hypothetical protein n=1 Tax=Alistipes sp. TaxID=1872444 RepID=UPI0023F1A1CE|nr:hypothetical protein [Alistipes sp.]MBE5689675.1 hypothetical protein [Alistipes sp.]
MMLSFGGKMPRDEGAVFVAANATVLGDVTLLILGLLFSAFESLNKDHTLAEEKTLDRSVCYRPMIRLADSLFPLLEWAKEQVSIDEQELWSDNSPER